MLSAQRIRSSLRYIINNEGYSDLATLRNITRIIDNDKNVDANNIPQIILSSIIKGILKENSTFLDVLSNIKITNPINEDVMDDIAEMGPMTHDETVELRSYINNMSINSMIKNTVQDMSDSTYSILKGNIHDPYELRRIFTELTEKVFEVTSIIDKGLEKDEIQVHKENTEDLLESIKNYLQVSKIIIPTTLFVLDNVIFDEGLHSSRFYLFVLKSGGGKSTIMLSLAQLIQRSIKTGDFLYNQIMKDKCSTILKPKLCVYYYTFENSKDETLERYYQGILSKKISNIDEFEKVKDKLADEFNQYDVGLEIRYRSSFSMTPADITREIEDDMSRGIVPIAVFVDYLNLLKAENAERRIQLERSTAGLKDVAVRFNCPVISGTQIKKDSYNNENQAIDLADIKESSGIIDNSDVIIGAWDSNLMGPNNHNDPTKDDPIKYLNFKSLKQRNFSTGLESLIKVDFSKFSLFNLDKGEDAKLVQRPPKQISNGGETHLRSGEKVYANNPQGSYVKGSYNQQQGYQNNNNSYQQSNSNIPRDNIQVNQGYKANVVSDPDHLF